MHNNEKLPSECNGSGTWSIIFELSARIRPKNCSEGNGTPPTTDTSSHRQHNQRRFLKPQYHTKEIKSNWHEILLVTRQSNKGTLSSVLGKRKGKIGRLFHQKSSNQTSLCHLRHISSPQQPTPVRTPTTRYLLTCKGVLNLPQPMKRTTDGQGLFNLKTDKGRTDTDIAQGTDGDN